MTKKSVNGGPWQEDGTTADDVRERIGAHYDIPGSVVLEEVTRDTDLSTAIRVYPPGGEVDYDLPNQICWDLRGTYRWRAVALHDEDGNAIEWYAHDNEVMHYWPEFCDDPVWKMASIYEFIKSWDEDNPLTYALHPWPVDMDPDAEVVG